jgi:hypothetical protein
MLKPLMKVIRGNHNSGCYKSAPCVLVLNEEKSRMNLKEYIIIKGKIMDRQKILCSFRDMNGIAQLKILRWCVNKGFTSVADFHTYTVGHVDLLGTIIFFSCGKLV